MRFTACVAATGLLASSVQAWGSLGHITVAYIASHFVRDDTAAYFQDLLRNDTEHYLASVATWADTIRYTKWGQFSKNFHFIDAKDAPPTYCGVDLARDCKADGCVVSALQNYTAQLLDSSPSPSSTTTTTSSSSARRAQAAKFVVHFVGDIHQPLHAENVAMGGNGLHVRWGDAELNLHHVWDTSIAEKMLGDVRRRPYEAARAWAANLTAEIRKGKYMAQAPLWTVGTHLDDPIGTAMLWANQSNAFICTHVLPEGPAAIVGQQLAGDYFDKAAPVIELQIARAGYRLAAWLDLIAERMTASVSTPIIGNGGEL